MELVRWALKQVIGGLCSICPSTYSSSQGPALSYGQPGRLNKNHPVNGRQKSSAKGLRFQYLL